ncbi:ADP-ribosylation factor-like protein 15 [Meleagris gallopavo]|uniref:ADP-ribosylation factor-like protein 15 n=1 Tax=Meleagris gallopavo TaxID=9103 RepID=UPI0012AB3335|nr:ADP-ribosylation factor-like protein 15 [Meleagris gallopavo]
MSECIQLSFAVCRIGIYTIDLCINILLIGKVCTKYLSFRRYRFRQARPPGCVCAARAARGAVQLSATRGRHSPLLAAERRMMEFPEECTDAGVTIENILQGFSLRSCRVSGWERRASPSGRTPGADNIRKYWSRYYQGSQGVIFVLDSASSEDDLETARNELHSALQHPQLCTLPFLILANHQDKPAARSVQEIKKYFELEPLARGKRWILKPCSLDDMEAVKDSFSLLINLLEERDFEPSRM